MKKYIWLGILVLLVAIQFIRINKTNPTVDPQEDFLQLTSADAEISSLIKDACYDCHSHEVEYPWYTNIAPVSWWIKGHINNGVKHLNFSTWGTYEAGKMDHKLEECIEMVEKGEMPLKSFTWMHPEAKLTDNQREKLVSFFQSVR